MTVEEKARSIFTDDDLDQVGSRYVEQVQYRIAQLLRDQIEECAKRADKIAEEFTNWTWLDKQRYAPTTAEIAESIAENIRALAKPTEQKEQNDAR